jgi:hypothetical protein
MLDFIQSQKEFLIIFFALFFIWAAWSLRGIKPRDYFKTKTGQGILTGIVSVTVLTIGLVLLSGCTGTYFNDASVYAGLDYTKKDSPMCEQSGPDSHSTSNLGLKGNIYQSEDKRLRFNGKYTHHSCAFNEDSKSYDAIGAEIEYKLWER